MAALKYLDALVRKHIFSEKTAARTGENIGINYKQRHGRIHCAGYAGMWRLKQAGELCPPFHSSAHLSFPSLLVNVLKFFLQVRLYHGRTRKFTFKLLQKLLF